MSKRLKRRIAVNQSNFISEHHHLEQLFIRPLVPLSSGECIPPWITLITSWKCSHCWGNWGTDPNFNRQLLHVSGIRLMWRTIHWRKAQGPCPPTSSMSQGTKLCHWCCVDVVRLWSFSREFVAYKSERKDKKQETTDLEAKGGNVKDKGWG